MVGELPDNDSEPLGPGLLQAESDAELSTTCSETNKGPSSQVRVRSASLPVLPQLAVAAACRKLHLLAAPSYKLLSWRRHFRAMLLSGLSQLRVAYMCP